MSRMGKAERFAALLACAGLDPVETAEQFAVRRREITAARDAARQDLAGHQNALTETGRAGEGPAGRGGRGQRRTAQPAGAQDQHPEEAAGAARLACAASCGSGRTRCRSPAS